MHDADHSVDLCVSYAMPAPGAGATLLQVLRNDLALNGPKYGCALGQCGACTVLVDGVAARACVIAARGVAGRAITTLEGLPGRWQRRRAAPGAASLRRRAGRAMRLLPQRHGDDGGALLERNPDPDEAAIRRELAGNLCRCGTHVAIIRAVQRAAVSLRQASA